MAIAAACRRPLSHLIANAAKFSLQPGTITIAVRRVAKTVQIMVKDQGEGIDPAFLPHAFELFAQQDQTLARTLGGLGVGLTLTRRIAQLHGGDVEAFSDGQGHGSEFVLWLPLAEAEAGADARAAGRAAPQRELSRPHRRGRSRRAREPAPADGAVGQRRQHRARRARPRSRSPRASGRRSSCATSACRAWTAFASSASCASCSTATPVVFAAVTGYASPEDQQRALAAGYDSFFVKPLNPTGLANLLRAYAEQRRGTAGAWSAHLVEGARLAERVALVGSVFLEPVVERLQADAERRRGLFLVTAEVLERRQRELPLDLRERRADAHRERRRRRGAALALPGGLRQASSSIVLRPGVIT